MLAVVLLPVNGTAQSVLLHVEFPPFERAQTKSILTVASIFPIESDVPAMKA